MKVGHPVEFFDTGVVETPWGSVPSGLVKVDNFEHFCHDGVALAYQSLPSPIEPLHSTIEYFLLEEDLYGNHLSSG
jgi:hypothetical protein